MISVEQLTVDFGGNTPLFDNVNFLINLKDRIALVGKNGAGKTTLLRLIAGKAMPSSGKINMPKDIKIGYLPQQMVHNDGNTVLQETTKAFEHLTSIQQQITQINLELRTRVDYDSQTYNDLISQLTQAQEYLRILGEANFEAEIEKTLIGLGFERSDFNRKCEEFSGGWRMRIELAKILLQRPQVLLLDEPTNHLDIESIQWLESFLINAGSALVLVSHDKTFIDNVTHRTIEISLGKIYDYPVHYSSYISLRKERYEQQLRAWENQQKMIQDTEEFIERFRYKATKSVQVQSRIKQLDKLERIEIDLEDNARLNLQFPPAPHSGIIPIEIENLRKSYQHLVVFEQVHMVINRGDKVAFVGKNGAGKSTLVKCIMNEIQWEGTLKLGHQVKIGYFAQNQASLLDEELTVFQTIDYVAVGDVRTKIRDILGAFMFGGEAIDKKVKVLSGGERTRLAMIQLLLKPVNLLILDEPTNHLDMRSKEVLKTAIKKFNGTVILVSHDRDFLDGLATKVFEFGNQRVREHLGGIRDFLHYKKWQQLTDIESNAEWKKAKSNVEKVDSEQKINYEARKEHNRKIRKSEKEIADSESAIQQLELNLQRMNQMLLQNEHASDPNFIMEYQKVQRELEHKMYEWELQCEALETLKTEL